MNFKIKYTFEDHVKSFAEFTTSNLHVIDALLD